jgi:small subunit ribosomal protein S5
MLAKKPAEAKKEQPEAAAGQEPVAAEEPKSQQKAAEAQKQEKAEKAKKVEKENKAAKPKAQKQEKGSEPEKKPEQKPEAEPKPEEAKEEKKKKGNKAEPEEETAEKTDDETDDNADENASPLPKEVLDEFKEDEETVTKPEKAKPRDRLASFDDWTPRTTLGKKVKSKEITNLDDILSKGLRILEPEIVEILLPELDSELLLTGQAKGKFGGGKRRVFKQTQKKTAEGNKPRFATVAVVGDSDGHVGIGFGKSKDTVPAREKATKQAKVNVIKIKRGCGSWECGCKEPHSIPFKVYGKSSSVEVTLLPAPKGNGIVAEKEVKKILDKAGIKDIWVNASGLARNKFNLVKAVEKALYQLSAIKVNDYAYVSSLGIIDGSVPKEKPEQPELEEAGQAEEAAKAE